MRLESTVDVETENATDVADQIEANFVETEYELNYMTSFSETSTVRIFAEMETSEESLDEDKATMVDEMNSVDGVNISESDIELYES